MITKLSLKNVLRNKRRTLITLAVIVIGVSMLLLALAYVEFIKWGVSEGVIHGKTGHFQFTTRNFLDKEEGKILEFGIDNWPALAATIAKIPAVALVTPRIGFSALGSTGDKSTGIMVQAVIPENEIKLGGNFNNRSAYKPLLVEPDGILIGPGLAKLLKVKIGASVTLMTTTATGALNAFDYKVIGLVSMGFEEMDKRFAVISLASAQQLLNSRRVERVLVGLKRTEDLPLAIAQAAKLAPDGLALRRWNEVDQTSKQVLNFFYQFIAFFLPVLMIIVWFSTMNTVLMSVLERSPELATLRAMGTSRFRLFRLLFSEGVWIGIIGVALGIGCELILSSIINHARMIMPPPPGYSEGYPILVRNILGNHVFVAVMTLIIVSLSTVIPARRIFKMNIVKALRGS
jgi:putative ABC transport system permease protein